MLSILIMIEEWIITLKLLKQMKPSHFVIIVFGLQLFWLRTGAEPWALDTLGNMVIEVHLSNNLGLV